MKKERKTNGYWNYDKCKEEALKYKKLSEFQEFSRGAYSASKIKGWINEICIHMNIKEVKSYGYWNFFENCKHEALKYTSKRDFQKGSNRPYFIALKNGWLDEICSHMLKIRKPKGYWNYESCKLEALKYNSKTDFENNSPRAYNLTRMNNWINDLCSHMIPQGSLQKRHIYAYEFEDNHVYVGLTCNIKERDWQHKNENNSQVYRHIEKTGLEPQFKQITKELIDIEYIGTLETETVEKYRTEGWFILNVAKPGSLGGGNLKWTYEKCKEEALKYDNKTEFQNMSGSAYNSVRKNGWFDDVCNHMKIKQAKAGYWNNYELCKNESYKYKNRSSFEHGNFSAYKYSKENGWLNEFYPIK